MVIFSSFESWSKQSLMIPFVIILFMILARIVSMVSKLYTSICGMTPRSNENDLLSS